MEFDRDGISASGRTSRSVAGTRVALAAISGEVLAVAAGPAGNATSVGLEVSAQRIAAATRQSLAQVGRSADLVLSAVLGLAGGARADQGYLDAALPDGIAARSRLVSDLSVAFSAATPAAEGYVLVAGTGAVAGRILDGDLQERRDGWGWLLGDEGSGFWLGREVIRAALAELQAYELPPVEDSSAPPLHTRGQLTDAVVEITGTADPVAIVQLCYANPPVWLASFAPLVSRHADDPVAAAIAARAGDLLVATLVGLGLRSDLPVVLAGSVVTRPGPVRDAVRRQLDAHLDHPVLTAESGLVGALWLAARQIGITDQKVHARLGTSLGRTSGMVV
jgi:glucosamine kinase